MDKAIAMIAMAKSFVMAHPKYIMLAGALILVAVVMAGCAMFKSADKYKIAYDVGKLATTAYLTEQGQLSPQIQDMVTKVWEAFRDNADKVTVETISAFPSLVKGQLVAKIPDAAMRDKANAMVDKYWDKLKGELFKPVDM